MRLTEKVVAERPEPVSVNLNAIPRHEMDALCRAALRLTEATFKDPAAVADYEKLLIARYGKREAKKRLKKGGAV